MNILILSWRGPDHPNEGGAELVTQKHAKAWVKAGHKVTLFTSSFKGCEPSQHYDKVKVIRRGEQSFGVKLQAIRWYLFENKEKFDLVIDHFHGIPFFTPLYVKTKIIAFIHETAKNVWKFNPWPRPFNLIPWLLGNSLERLIFILYKGISFITVSNSTKADLIKWGIPEANINIITNGLDKPKVKKYRKNNQKTLIFLGAISYDKGILDALKCFEEINKKYKNWDFWIVGKSSPDMKRMLMKLVNDSAISKNTKYWGYVSEKKKFELLSKAHVLINPSIREGWGLVNIEANSVNTPVVGYDVAGVRDSVINGETGVLCNEGDCECIAKETVKLLNDKRKYKKMQHSAKKWANNFTWPKSTKKSLELIETIVI